MDHFQFIHFSFPDFSFIHPPQRKLSTQLTTMAGLEEARLREAMDYMKEADKK